MRVDVAAALADLHAEADLEALRERGARGELDVVVNGLAAYWRGMGQASGSYIASLVDGGDHSWRDVLTSMRVDLPWQAAYDPMRAVIGELDNTYTPTAPIELR